MKKINSFSHFSLLYFYYSGVKLWHTWQEITYYFWGFQDLAILPGESGLFYQYCYGSQKPWVLFYYQDIDSEVNIVVWVPLSVQSCY